MRYHRSLGLERLWQTFVNREWRITSTKIALRPAAAWQELPSFPSPQGERERCAVARGLTVGAYILHIKAKVTPVAHTMTLRMFDSYGNGWNGYKLRISGSVYTFSVGSSSSATLPGFVGGEIHLVTGGSNHGEAGSIWIFHVPQSNAAQVTG